MSVKIFYFSGTGNSLLLGRRIKAHMKDAELIPAVSIYGGHSKKIEADTVGLIFPVYCLDIPDLVKEIIKKNDFSSVQYFFAAVTCGGYAGNVLNSLDRILVKKGKKLNSGFEVKIGDNSIVYSTSREKLEHRLEGLEGVSLEIASIVNKRKTDVQGYRFKVSSVFNKYFLNIALSKYFRIDKKSVIKENCSQCDLCTKLCPVNNIRIVNGNVKWGKNCERCFGCINWCPQGAIRFGKIKPGLQKQYRCPGISVADIIHKDDIKPVNELDNCNEGKVNL